MILRYTAQLVIPSERAAASCEEEGDGGVGEVGANFLVRPVPAVAPVIRCAHGAVALPVEVGGGHGYARDGDVGKRPECRSKLTRALQLEIRARDSHGWAPAVNFTV